MPPADPRIESPALRGTRLGRLLRYWNPVYRRLLAGPLHWPWSSIALVIEFTGVVSGRTYRTPVHYVRDGEELLLTTGDRWWGNLVGGARVKVWLHGQERVGIGEPVLDEDESLRLHERMLTRRPIFGRLMGVEGPSDHQQLRRSIRAGRTVVVVRLEG